MKLKLGNICIRPEDKEISIPVDVYMGNETNFEPPKAYLIYQTSFDANKPLSEYFKESEEYARKTIKELNQ
ncbi:hypothetical protein [Proteus terrae]|uniref:hypothetical protein n=1 Tax=Proteus terrae TaxID=1574161 RepID=UPI00298BF391|nr:hypothetical protein [Proteus terrae]WPD00399.1 hypothetical protein R5P25_07780 [Proteus terrae]